MHVTLLCTPYSAHTGSWAGDQLTRRGHHVDRPPAVESVASAADAGHHLVGTWAAGRPDVVLALGWEAGLAAQVAVRGTSTPVVLRLTRAGRQPGTDRDRLETALARGSSLVLAPSAGEVDRLVDRGVPRGLLRVLPEAVDRTRFVDQAAPERDDAVHRVALVGAEEGSLRSRLLETLSRLPRCEPVALPDGPVGQDAVDRPDLLRSVDAVVATDDSDAEVSLVLQAMSCGVPTVAVDTGVVSDVVAHDVTGLLVHRAEAVPEALRSLLADPMRRESMGLAAVDRARARFDTAVVGAHLERLLLDGVPQEVHAAAS